MSYKFNISMLRIPALILLAVLFANTAYAEQHAVELIHQLQPDRDVVVKKNTDALITIQVLEDRGVIANSYGRLSLAPVTMNVRETESIRYITGKRLKDRSFSTQVHYLEKISIFRGPDGIPRIVPDNPPLQGVKVSAVIEGDGRPRHNSVKILGAESSLSKKIRLVIQNVLEQVASIPRVVLRPNEDVVQDMPLQVPIPGLGVFDMTMKVSNRLQGVKDGIANVRQVYTMGVATEPRGWSCSGEGSGNGSILYDTRSNTILSAESITVMRMRLEGSDGVIEMRLSGKQTESTHTFAEPPN
ncbi:MAG: hypothetical protein ACK4FF_09250 [Limnobacter sp.]|uniref:hypothetical protein n=1 Tax=Limnobacter sp. TaxID=2003368 RepID=UPI00391BC79F